MRISVFKWFAAVLVIFTSFASCKKSSDNPDFTGNYVIGSVTLSGTLVVPTNETGNFTVPIGTDVTMLIQNDLLSSENCTTPDKVLIELRKDLSLYFSCGGSDPLEAGTWQKVSDTGLILNLYPQALKSTPNGFELYVSNIIIDQTGFVGNASLVIPKDQASSIIAPMQLTLNDSAPEGFVVNLAIQFASK